jgi:hypothetical protein
MAGTILVKWSNIKELQSVKRFAIVTAKQNLTRHDAFARVPQGQLDVKDKQITVTSISGTKTIPVAEASRIVDSTAFDKAVNHPEGLTQGWIGAATSGVSLVRSTQNATTFTGAINVARSAPGVDWLPARNRTLLNYNQAYGTVSQAGFPTVKSNIFHANAERDEYFSPRVYTFASVTYDHNFSQSLDLQQAYGAGIGITLLHSPRQQLDFKGDAHYQKEVFFDPTQNVDLFGSTFSESYLRHLPKGLAFNEFGSVSPSWNQPSAYSTHVNAALIFPIYKGFGYNVGAVDDFLNNAPPGSHKNSSQFTTGITYTIKPR